MSRLFRFVPFGILVLSAACSGGSPGEPATPNLAVPAWPADVVWYQIFVERFRNGDPSNDPTAEDVAGFTRDAMPADWRVTPWTWDWYR